MKATKSLLTLFALLAFMSFTAFVGDGSKVIAVVNHADWCPACKNNGERAQAAFMKSNSDKAVQFIKNDLTNDETKAKSALALKEAGLEKIMASNTGTGMVYFFNSETKELISKISVAKTDNELATAVVNAKKGL